MRMLADVTEIPGRAVALVCACLLFAAFAGRWHYGFYTLLRFVVCVGSLSLMAMTVDSGRAGWAIPFAATALIFNPLIPFYMHRGSWRVFDVVTMALMLAFVVTYHPVSRRAEQARRGAHE